jgi:hypothetical protein
VGRLPGAALSAIAGAKRNHFRLDELFPVSVVSPICRVEMAMIADLIRFEVPRLAHFGRNLSVRHLRAPPGWLLAILVAGLGFGIMLFGRAHNGAENRPVARTVAVAEAEPSPAANSAQNTARSSPVNALAMATPTDAVKISSQSWHRGGLGSKALVTVALRNDNDYAVGDIGLLCTFSAPDGSVVTERRPTIPDVVKPKSRKTFVRFHAGFVNIRASRAKCSLLSASRL